MSVRALLAVVLIASSVASAAPVEAECTQETYVYLATDPGSCNLGAAFGGDETLNIYVVSGNFSDVTGVTFRLVTSRFGPEHIQSISTPDGVTITGGDIFSGIGLMFSSRQLDHDPVLTIEVSGHLGYGDVETRDILLIRGTSADVVPPFVTTGQIIHYDCTNEGARWFPPDVVEVPVDQDDAFCFLAVVETNYFSYGSVRIIDPLGWVPESFEQAANTACGEPCGWRYTPVTVPVHVPNGVSDGATNEVTVQALQYGRLLEETTILLRAVSPIATERTTWGHIKSLYQ